MWIPREAPSAPAMNDELFDILITRRPDAPSAEDGGNTRDEWLAVAYNDPDLVVRDYVCGRNPATGEHMKVALVDGAVFSQSGGDAGPIFRFENGRIVSLWADRATQAKAREIADRLDAELVLGTD